MQINKTDQNDAEGLAQIVRTGWFRSVHVKSFDSHRARTLLGARTQLVGMRNRLSNHIRGVLKTFGLLPVAMRGLPFDRKVEVLLQDRSDVAPIVRPLLVAWRQLREQITAFDKEIHVLVRSNSACRLLMSVPGIGVLSVLAYVSTVEDPAINFSQLHAHATWERFTQHLSLAELHGLADLIGRPRNLGPVKANIAYPLD
jgi:transposase